MQNNNGLQAFEKLAHGFVVIMSVLMLAAWADNARADECPTFTHEQEWLLHAAYTMGEPHDWGYTLAAIVWKESFLEDEVHLVNPADGDYGSYGPAHVQATTAVDLDGLEQTPANNLMMADKLLNNRVVGIQYGLRYLLRHSDRTYIGTIRKYNGAGPRAVRYAEDVYQRVLTLMNCHPWQ